MRICLPSDTPARLLVAPLCQPRPPWLSSALFVVVVLLGCRPSPLALFVVVVLGCRPWSASASRHTMADVLSQTPAANGAPLKEWPCRVAVIAQGRLMTYCPASLAMSRVQVVSPFDIMKQWAEANSVRVSKLHTWFVLLLSPHSCVVGVHRSKWANVAVPFCRLGRVRVAPRARGRRHRERGLLGRWRRVLEQHLPPVEVRRFVPENLAASCSHCDVAAQTL